MKTIKQIIATPPVFLNNWSSAEEVFSDFEDNYYTTSAIEDKDKINILFASYGTDNYAGDAFVLYEKDGVLYEQGGGHCSCYGLEGQWNLKGEEVVLDELSNRLIKGTFGQDDYSGNTFSTELKQFLGI